MRKAFLFIVLSADGYFEGIDHDLSWFIADQEFVEYSNAQLDEVDTLVFGRRTFDLMESYWQSDQVEAGDLVTAKYDKDCMSQQYHSDYHAVNKQEWLA